MLQSNSPLFSNDLAGFVKACVMIGGPIFTGVFLFLKLGNSEKIAQVKRETERATELVKGDVNGLGTRVDNLVVEMTRIRSDVDRINGAIVDSQRDIMAAIAASSEAQLRAVHAADLQTAERFSSLRVDVGRLQERNDLGQCLVEFGKSIERLIEKMDVQQQRPKS